MPDAGQWSKRSTLLFLLFLASGATSLAYEILWTKRLTLAIGASILPVSAVVSSFMGGMAVGAFFIGRRIDRIGSPLRIYALLEFGIAAWALVFLPLLDLLTPVYTRVQLAAGFTGPLHGFLLFLLAFLPLLPPAILMGGTLPALVSHFERGRGHVAGIGVSTGRLYGVNTLGAVFGSLVTGFVLIGALGLFRTNLTAVFVTCAVALAALLLSRERASMKEAAHQADRPVRKETAVARDAGAVIDHRRRSGLIALYALSGFTALGYEVAWTRILINYVGTTSYAFTLMLASFLTGIGTGSLLYSRIEKRYPLELRHFGIAEAIIGFTGAVGLLGVIWLPWFHLQLVGSGGHVWWKEALLITSASASLMLLPTLAFGFAFPLVSGLISRGRNLAGGDVGAVYAANTTGSILGSAGAAFLFIPLLGSGGAVLFFSACNLVIAGAAFLMSSLRRKMVAAGTAFVLAVILPAAVPSSIYEEIFPEEATLFFQEGSEATVAVVRDGDPLSFDYKRMIVNGDALSGSDYSGKRYMRLLGHLPVLLCERPERVLVVCLGTGMTLGACAEHHEVRDLVCLEISPVVVRGARQFTDVNHAVLDGGRARLLTGDGRNYLLIAPGDFDVITLEPPPPRARGVVNLYTRDFYELCRNRLSEHGVMAQWIPLHDQSEKDVKILIRTFLSVFEHTTAWLVERHDLCLIGTKQPLSIDQYRLTARMRSVSDRLREIDIYDRWDLLSLFVADESGLERYCGDVPVVTDDRPLIERFLSLPWNRTIISVSAGGDHPLEGSFLEDILDHRTALVRHLRGGFAESDALEYLLRRLAMEHFLQATIFADRGLTAGGVEELRTALRILPDHGYYRHYLGTSDEQREEVEDRLVRGGGDGKTILSRYGFMELENGRYERAVEIFSKYAELFPGDPAGFVHLAMAREGLGDLDGAEAAFEKALPIAGDQREGIERRLEVIEAKRGFESSNSVEDLERVALLLWKGERYDEAADWFEKLVEREPESDLAWYNYAASLEAAGYYLRARDAYIAALKLAPSVEETRNNVDKITLFLTLMGGKPRKVVLTDGREVLVDPGHAPVHTLLAQLYARNDEYGLALQSLERALAIDPDSHEARRLLSMVEEMIEQEAGG